MKFKLLMNIGHDDARRLCLAKVKDGDVVDLDAAKPDQAKAAEELVRRGLAEPAEATPPKK